MSNWSYKRMQRLILPRGSNYWCLKCTCVNKMFESLACIWQNALVTNNQSLHGDSYHFPENWKFNPILHLWKMTNSPPCQDRDQFSNKYSAPVIDLWIFYLWLPRFGFGLESAKKDCKKWWNPFYSMPCHSSYQVESRLFSSSPSFSTTANWYCCICF